ncbi:acetate--CoA ligase family protein [Nisaea acidiphila]|uniref:Acetate--CoA ligase family protein n=1 Tax=Nisaea acidiphila TaxID=1862145 RepID=A0A9J7ARE2_9PROT|nr:acetate--CoA ligase family protein [Nisaea acidiphila]UUX49807.1 acetate--CoA ligase family protein [Nisaea acidiphila]
MNDLSDLRKRNLARLIDPKSFAVIGATDDPLRIGGRPIDYSVRHGFSGRIYPVNPKRETIQGLKAYPSISDVPEAVDAAIVALPAPLVAETVEACAAKGVGACIVFSSGFSELGAEGDAMQARLTEISRRTGIRVLGPNCLGAFNAATGWIGTFSSAPSVDPAVPGPIAIASQSGAYGGHIYNLARKRGLKVGRWVTTGNESDIELSECISYLLDDPEVKVVMSYAEGIRDGAGLKAAFEKARDMQKPIVMVKVGRSEVGAAAAASHTAALAGTDAVIDGMMRQYGVYRADDANEMLEVAYGCQHGHFPDGNKLGFITISGGLGVQMADSAAALGLEVPEFSKAGQEKMLELFPFAAARNPVDVTGQAFNDKDAIAKCLKIMMEEGDYDVVISFFTAVASLPEVAKDIVETLKPLKDSRPDKHLFFSILASEENRRFYESNGYPMFDDPVPAITAANGLMYFGRAFAAARGAPPALPAGAETVPAVATAEHEAKRILASAGIPVVREYLAATADEAALRAGELGGRVVLKIASPDIAHKTEIGGVLVGLEGDAAVREGFETLMARAAEKRPDAKLDGVIVCEMVSGGVETVIGVQRDPVLGPAVMFGLGGVLVEVLKDVSFRLAPFSVEEAHRMIREIKGFKILEGVRGAPPADIDALAEALAKLSVFAAANEETLDSIDINPFIVLPEGKGAVAVDALIVPATGESA